MAGEVDGEGVAGGREGGEEEAAGGVGGGGFGGVGGGEGDDGVGKGIAVGVEKGAGPGCRLGLLGECAGGCGGEAAEGGEGSEWWEVEHEGERLRRGTLAVAVEVGLAAGVVNCGSLHCGWPAVCLRSRGHSSQGGVEKREFGGA